MAFEFPLWASIIILVALLALSGLFSGLNLGLMSLSIFELEILEASSDKQEKKCAQRIKPIRSSGNILLCTLLISNVVVNTSLTLITDSLFAGIKNTALTIFVSSSLTVLFGEIIPQAVCTKYGLWIGAKTIYLTKLLMILLYPLVWPIGKVLDLILGKEVGATYDRDKMRELVKHQSMLLNDEVNIITGALDMTTKHVKDVMTNTNDIYMISAEMILNFQSVSEIMASGFSRIPVYYDNRFDVRDVLFVKDLSFVDPDENIPVKTIVKFYDRPVMKVDENLPLNKILKSFKEGRTHLAIVHSNESKITGLITMEDVIEEILQMEIMDETDVYTDNVRKIRRSFHTSQNFNLMFNSRKKTFLSPQQKMATLQYMTTNISCFSERFLPRELVTNILEAKSIEYTFPKTGYGKSLYTKNKDSDRAILLIQGRVLVTMGKENLKFEAGSFIFFGENLLDRINICISKKESYDSIAKKAKFTPDYTVTPLTDLQLVEISSAYYLQLRELANTLDKQHEGPKLKISPNENAPNVNAPKLQIIGRTSSEERREKIRKLGIVNNASNNANFII